jgi:type IV secretory pathway VirB9-like protein
MTYKTLLAAVITTLCVGSAGAAEKPAWAASNGVRTEVSTPETVIPLTFNMRNTTLLVLPDHEDILLDDVGDRSSWTIVVNHNIASISPKVPGAKTNLNIITKAGAVYSFTLKEDARATPDLKVFVTVPETEIPAARKFYTAAEYEAGLGQVTGLQSQVTELRAALDAARQEADTRAAAVKQHAPARFHFDYKPVKNEKPFNVTAVFHDGTFTYIQTSAPTKFTVVEKIDGKPSTLDFQIENGTYIIPKVLDQAELIYGTHKLPLTLKSGAGN